MVDDKLEIDVVRYFMEECHRRCGNLAKGADSPLAKSFGYRTHEVLTALVRELGQVEEKLINPPKPEASLFDSPIHHCHTVSGE